MNYLLNVYTFFMEKVATIRTVYNHGGIIFKK